MLHYFIIYKPYKVVSRFGTAENKKTLRDYFSVPLDVYPVGRLDEDSEGLLILTNDTRLNQKLLHPAFAHEREYLVQVEGKIKQDAIQKLCSGIVINIKGKKQVTKKCTAQIESAPLVPDRDPPIRYRKEIPTSWLRITLTEGKNRQVRRMTAAVGFPTLRLIRTRIQQIHLQHLQPGEMISIPANILYRKLFG